MSSFGCCIGRRSRADDYSHLYEQGYGHPEKYRTTQRNYHYPIQVSVPRVVGYDPVQLSRDLVESFAYQILNGNAAEAFHMIWQKRAVLKIDIDGLKCMGAGVQFLGACCDEMVENHLVNFYFKQMLATKRYHHASVDKYVAKIEFDLRHGPHTKPRLHKGEITFEIRHGLIYKMVMRQK